MLLFHRQDPLSILVEAFEREHYPIPPPDPIAAIEHCMESRGLTRKDLEPSIGSRARVSEVMAPATLRMIRRLTVGLEIPTDALITAWFAIDAVRTAHRILWAQFVFGAGHRLRYALRNHLGLSPTP